MNEDLREIDARIVNANAKRLRRRGKPRATETLPKINGPRNRPQDKVLIPVGRVKDSWFAEGERRKKYRNKTWVDLSSDVEGNQAGEHSFISCMVSLLTE